MSFLTKCGQILDIITGGFTLPTEEQDRINEISTFILDHVQDKTTMNARLAHMQQIQAAFDYIPEGRTVEAETSDHGIVKLQKKDGKIQIV